MRFLITFCFFFFTLGGMAQGNSQRANTQPAHARVVYIAPEAIKEPEMVSLELFFKDTLQSDSFFNANFANYSLPKKQLNYNDDSGYKAQELKQKYSRSWFFIVVGIILILLLFIKFNFSKLYKNALRSFYQRSATAEVINDKYSPRWLFVLFSNLFFVLVISLWVCRNFIRLEAPLYEERLDQFFWIFLIILIVYIGKFLIHLLAGMLFQITESVIIYILNISITHLLCGIVMFFVTLLLMYSPWHGQQWLINVSFAIIITFIVVRYLRGMLQTVQYFRYNYLYLILYLCALEIAPWFLIVKFLNNYL